jgi:hypothetical protein
MGAFTLTLDDQEKAYLANLVDSDLRETRVEMRHTRTPGFHDELIIREKLVRGLLEKLQGDKPPEAVAPRP